RSSHASFLTPPAGGRKHFKCVVSSNDLHATDRQLTDRGCKDMHLRRRRQPFRSLLPIMQVQHQFLPLLVLLLLLNAIVGDAGQLLPPSPRPPRGARPPRSPPSPLSPPSPEIPNDFFVIPTEFGSPSCLMIPLTIRESNGLPQGIALPDLSGSIFPTAFRFPQSSVGRNCNCPLSEYNLLWGADAQNATRRYYTFRVETTPGPSSPLGLPSSLIVQLDPERTAGCYSV
ncbi:hypothetical protein Vafri_4917, partial [Volvox africanus]